MAYGPSDCAPDCDERSECVKAGEPLHQQCGRCTECGEPVHHCGGPRRHWDEDQS